MSATRSALEEADWEQEMSLFRKRLQKPNQLETLRKIVEEVDTGKVRDSFMRCGGLTRHACVPALVHGSQHV